MPVNLSGNWLISNFLVICYNIFVSEDDDDDDNAESVFTL